MKKRKCLHCGHVRPVNEGLCLCGSSYHKKLDTAGLPRFCSDHTKGEMDSKPVAALSNVKFKIKEVVERGEEIPKHLLGEYNFFRDLLDKREARTAKYAVL